jgi:hypothetical protein
MSLYCTGHCLPRSTRGHQDDCSSSPAWLPGSPTSAATWPALALWGTLCPAAAPPSILPTSRGATASNHVPDLPLATATSLVLLLLTPSTTPSRRFLPNLPLPVSPLSFLLHVSLPNTQCWIVLISVLLILASAQGQWVDVDYDHVITKHTYYQLFPFDPVLLLR